MSIEGYSSRSGLIYAPANGIFKSLIKINTILKNNQSIFQIIEKEDIDYFDVRLRLDKEEIKGNIRLLTFKTSYLSNISTRTKITVNN